MALSGGATEVLRLWLSGSRAVQPNMLVVGFVSPGDNVHNGLSCFASDATTGGIAVAVRSGVGVGKGAGAPSGRQQVRVWRSCLWPFRSQLKGCSHNRGRCWAANVQAVFEVCLFESYLLLDAAWQPA